MKMLIKWRLGTQKLGEANCSGRGTRGSPVYVSRHWQLWPAPAHDRVRSTRVPGVLWPTRVARELRGQGGVRWS
jgi:hypothetical protein